MSGMRVLVLSSVFPSERQPTLGVFVRERMRRVARRCEVVVVAPIPWFPLNRLIRGARVVGVAPVESQAGLTVHHPPFFCVPRYGKWCDGAFEAASLVPFLARLRREFPFDLIDAHFAYPDGVAAAILGRLFDRPVVITLRGSIVRLATYPLHRPQIRRALLSARRVLSVSESLARVAAGIGIPREKIRVIPNGADTERFFPRPTSEARAVLGLPADRPTLISVGGINEGKGHHRIVALLPELTRHHPDLLYVIVGGDRPGDSTRPLIERLVRRHGLEAHVRLAGERPHAEIPLWLAAADVVCLATRSEGWANVLLEALACGRPVVTTRVGGNPEIVAGERLGLLVPPGDDAAFARAILEALARPWDGEAMVGWARAHSWDAAAARVVEEFEQVLAAPAAPLLVEGSR